MKKSKAYHLDIRANRKNPYALLRHSYREDGKVKKETFVTLPVSPWNNFTQCEPPSKAKRWAFALLLPWQGHCIVGQSSITSRGGGLQLPQTLNEILHILSVTPFEKMPISSVFFAKNTHFQTCANPNQLMLFDL